jgi:hypothetical protein
MRNFDQVNRAEIEHIRNVSRSTIMTTQTQILDFYSRPASMTSAGKHAALLERLPNDVHSLVRIVQGLVIHEFVASSFYGVVVPDQRKSESHIRPVEEMLDRILALDHRPLTVPRPPERRLVGVCRHFMVLLLAMLRAKRIPARGCCGFVPYFNPGFFEDHVVCEYWSASEERWLLADAQLDDVWRRRLGISPDVLDVPRDWFMSTSDAWAQCRTGLVDANKIGTVNGGLRGLWFVGASLIHELAALNKVETLPWDVWGAMPRPNEPLGEDQLTFFDGLATLTQKPDSSFEELHGLYNQDDRIHVPETVFNAVLNEPQRIISAVGV